MVMLGTAERAAELERRLDAFRAEVLREVSDEVQRLSSRLHDQSGPWAAEGARLAAELLRRQAAAVDTAGAPLGRAACPVCGLPIPLTNAGVVSFHDADAAGQQCDGSQCAPAEAAQVAEQAPMRLRWGLDDVEYADDGSIVVLLSGPAGEPYVLELDRERAAALREALADDVAPGRTAFYEVGSTYTGSYGWRFRVDTITRHPEDGERTALGWRFFNGVWDAIGYGEYDWLDHQATERDATESGGSDA